MKRFVAVGVAVAVLTAAGLSRAITFSDLDKPKPPTQPPKPPPTKAVTPGKPTPPPKPADGPTDTFEQRDAVCHQNQRCTVDSLRLPWAKCAKTAPPAKVLAGNWAMPHESSRQREFFWTIIPLKTGHGIFMERYAKAATDDERFALVDWCTANGLSTCADFTLRAILHAHWGDIRHPSYMRALEAWRPRGAKRPSPFTFDLPVKGPWYVEKETAGLLQVKHGALFGVNLIIKDRKGRQYNGPPNEIASYYAWSKPFFAICDGVIVRVEDHYDDPPLRRAGDLHVANAIYQDCGGGVFAFYAHIRKGSAKVKEGDRVQRGQELGLVGNSGGDGLPHLHFIMLDGDYVSIPGRFRFEQMTPRGWIRRDGAPLVEDTYIRPVTEPAEPAAKPATPPKGPAR